MEENKVKKDLELFSNLFPDEKACLDFLSEIKWKNGFVCDKCGHTNFCNGKTSHSRRCTRCKKEISPTAHTLFHRCRLPLKIAFKIVYLSCKYPEISSYSLSRYVDVRRMTCYQFQKRVKNCKEGEKENEFISALMKDLLT